MRSPLLARLDAGDRALFTRLVLGADTASAARTFWCLLTHAGGARGSIALALVPWLAGWVAFPVAWRALLLLGVSHAVVQLVKRFAVRERPSTRLSIEALIAVPDRFSFPSGHACAAMAIAAAYAWVAPALAVPLLLAALLVGLSRVMLGVHYPGDVAVGQAIAVATGWGFVLVGG